MKIKVISRKLKTGGGSEEKKTKNRVINILFSILGERALKADILVPEPLYIVTPVNVG